MNEEKTVLEITSDPTTARSIIQSLVKELRGKDGKPANREVALAVTKLQEADHWLAEAMFTQWSAEAAAAISPEAKKV